MRTDDLIENLSRSTAPLGRHAALGRIALALAAGSVAALGLVLATLGVRPDLEFALMTIPFWLKLAFTTGVAAAGLVLVRRLARPDGEAGTLWLAAVLPFAIMAVIGAETLIAAEARNRAHLFFGGSAMLCPFLVVAHGVPVFAALVWALRGLAPVSLRAAGFAAGLAAGGAGASAYALHCDESSAAFMAVWYALGMLMTGVLGALIGPRVLRW
jgi:hypothetical protein